MEFLRQNHSFAQNARLLPTLVVLIRASAKTDLRTHHAALDTKLRIAATSWVLNGRGHTAEKANREGQSGFQRYSVGGYLEGVI
jgi:hypothetical protein